MCSAPQLMIPGPARPNSQLESSACAGNSLMDCALGLLLPKGWHDSRLDMPQGARHSLGPPRTGSHNEILRSHNKKINHTLLLRQLLDTWRSVESKIQHFFRQKDQETTVLSLVQAKNVWKRYSLSIYLCNLLNNSHITYSEKNLCGNMILFFLAIERKSNYEKLKEIWHIQNQATLSQESHTCGCNSWLFGGEGRYHLL